MNSLYFEKRGSGPVLIFLHNGGGFHEIWSKQISHFENQFTCYAIDLMGFGESPEPAEAPNLDFHERSLDNFVKDQNIDSYHLVGNCIGSSIALFHTLKNPHKVKSLTMFNICPGIRIYETPLGRFLHKRLLTADKLKDFLGSLIIKAMDGKRERTRLPDLLFGKDPDVNSEIYKKFQRVYQTDKQKRGRLGLLQNIESFTTDKYFVSTTSLPPTLLFWGDHNKIVDLKEGFRLREIIKPNVFCELKGAGHMAMFENAEEVNLVMRKFLAEHVS